MEFAMQSNQVITQPPITASPLMTLAEVMQITTIKKTKIYGLQKDPTSGFPHSFLILKGAARWNRPSVMAWVEQQTAKESKQ
jgi:predicted DNA-binding transcriptional regulator AlpA